MAITINKSIDASGNSWAAGGTRSLSSVKYIVIHYTGVSNDTAKSTAQYFATHGERYGCA